MEAYNQDLLQDALHHLDKLKFDLTKLKLDFNRDRTITNRVDGFVTACDLIRFIIKSYDKHSVKKLCNIINHSFINQDCHGTIIRIYKKNYANNLDKGKMDYIEFAL